MKGASIIVATYNRSNILSKAVDSLLNQKTRHDYEIIIVNDGSTDNTKEVLKTYENNNKIKTINIEKNSGPAEARNLGFKTSKYLISIVMDDDCIADPHWLDEMLEPFSYSKIGISSNYFVWVDGERIF